MRCIQHQELRKICWTCSLKWIRWRVSVNTRTTSSTSWAFALRTAYLLRLHVKWRSAKSRQPVLTSLYRSVYIVWKSFTCGRRVDEHLLCRLVNKGLYGVGKHAHWLQISRSWQLLFMPVMKLVTWTMDRAAHCKIHPYQTCTDVYSMRWCHMCTVTGLQISHRFPEHNAEKQFGDYRLILHVSASA